MSRLLCCVAVAAGIVWPAAAWSEGAQTQKPRRTRNILVKPGQPVRRGRAGAAARGRAAGRRGDGGRRIRARGAGRRPCRALLPVERRRLRHGVEPRRRGERAGADLPERVRGRDGRRAGPRRWRRDRRPERTRPGRASRAGRPVSGASPSTRSAPAAGATRRRPGSRRAPD